MRFKSVYNSFLSPKKKKRLHLKKVGGCSANQAKTGRGFGEVGAASARLAAAAGRMFRNEGLGWLL